MGCLGATEGHTHAPAPPISTASGLNLEAGAGGTSTGGAPRWCVSLATYPPLGLLYCLQRYFFTCVSHPVLSRMVVCNLRPTLKADAFFIGSTDDGRPPPGTSIICCCAAHQFVLCQFRFVTILTTWANQGAARMWRKAGLVRVAVALRRSSAAQREASMRLDSSNDNDSSSSSSSEDDEGEGQVAQAEAARQDGEEYFVEEDDDEGGLE